MSINGFLLPSLMLCILFSSSGAIDICSHNKCKNGALCLPLGSNNDYKCDCISGYKGQFCEEKIENFKFCKADTCKNGAACLDLGDDYRCQCLNGWYGKNCELNHDDCANNPCQNGGVCKDLQNHKYQCECPLNYIGMHCEHKDICSGATPCGVNGKCVADNTGSYKCHCDKGFTGDHCENDVDECIQYSSPCENGGKCVNLHGKYRCECAKGYSGERCANDIVECKDDTCKNGGTCLDKIGHYKCVCTQYFRGTNCEIPIPICDLKPCKNNGKCRYYGNDYKCECPQQWTGTNCEKPRDLCSEISCENGGTCIPDRFDSFKCICKSGYDGRMCEHNIDDCVGRACQNGGQCKDLVNAWQCKCAPGFEGRYCQVNRDECQSKPCRNNGQCVDLINDYECKCPSGLKGKNCEINIDECASHPCANSGECDDRVGGFTCHCKPGFVGLLCESKSDVCGQLSPCKNGGECRNDRNAYGGYVCLCPPGITNKDCSTEVSQCTSLTCANGGRCTFANGRERCVCSSGFGGTQCEIETNECKNNPCQHGGTCQNLVNSYICHCRPGYEGKNCETNIDECNNKPCGPNGMCIDEINGYRCQCYLPYHGPTCALKYDPCKTSICANEAICIPNNDYKSYHCNCSMATGRFTGTYCDKDVNECILSSSALVTHQLVKPEQAQSVTGPCLNKGTCINTVGSFICKCDTGYNGKQCEINTDDCATDPCKNGARCDDLINGYKCHCLPGYSGDNCELEINECENNPCQNGAQCYDHINDYQCVCLTGFSGKNCQVNDDDCTQQSCSEHGTCIDKTNGFECHCHRGYMGRNCENPERPCDSNPCLNKGSCVNRRTSANEPGYMCNCRRGYSGPRCEVKMDWCRGSPCGDHGVCVLDKDGYKCNCALGYSGDRCEIENTETCESFAEKNFHNRTLTGQICKHNGHCFNQIGHGAFKCTCPSGYQGTFCEEKVDECAYQPCVNDGECVDGVGMFSCKCSPGFQGIKCQTNFDDCSSEPCNLGKCIDQINNFTCICPRGTSGRFCDIVKDNCKDVKCHNGGECRSKLGDFDCQCKAGFVGKYCEVDLNECRYSLGGHLLDAKEKPYGPCSPSGTASCVDGRASFSCVCRPGFGGRYCQSRIDVCENLRKEGKSPCYNSGVCVNQYHKWNTTLHGYVCKCPAGYGGDRCQTYNKQCLLNPCQNGGLCRPVDFVDKMSFVCDCPAGVGGLYCEKDYVNECETTSCLSGGLCVDGYGKAICRCPQGFCGVRCEIHDDNACNATVPETAVSYMEELSQCHRHTCGAKVNNKRCDIECNNFACGFDSGECLHKVPKSVDVKSVKLSEPWSNCTIIQTKNIPCHHWFMNGRCDPQCNTEQCLFDGWDCQKSIGQCPNKRFCDAHYGDSVCQMQCNTVECDFDGGDCLDYTNSTITGAIVLLLPVPTTEFVSVWQSKLLQSLTHLLHSIVRVKKQESGQPMIYAVRVFVESLQDNTAVRHKRSALVDKSQGKPGTKVYLEVDNSACKSTSNVCFDNSKAAAEFVTAALHSRSYRPPIEILSVQSDSADGPQPIFPPSTTIRNMLIYVILVMTCLIVLGILIGVLYGFVQNPAKPTIPKTKKAETWFPEGMKRLNQSASHHHQRRLGNTNRKRNQTTLNGLNCNSELGNLPQMMKSKISTNTAESIDDSGSNSLTSTRVTSYEINVNDNNNSEVGHDNNSSENSMLLANPDINCNFPPEKRLRLHMDSNKCASEQPNLETWCFNAFVHLLVSGNGLGELTANDSRDKHIIMEKLFHIAVNNQTNNENPNMFTDVPNKKELTNSSLTTIITSRIQHSGETLLHLAAKFNRKEAARFLLEAGSDPNKEDGHGRSCLLTSIDAGALEVVSYLLEQQNFPIDIHQKGPGGATCLIQAVKGAHIELIHIILQHTQPEECDLNVTDDYGRTALHWAAATNQIGVVQLLLSYGLNRDAQDNEEMTPLYLASREGSFEVCKVLIANGANPDMSDHLDRLPRDIAKANNFEEIVSLLDDYISLTKENQQHRPVMWGQYSYYSNNYYCPSHHMDLKSVLYSSPHSVNQLSCCVYPTDADRSSFYNSSLAAVTHSNPQCFRGNPSQFSNHHVQDQIKKRPSLHNPVDMPNSELKYNKHLKSPNYYKDPGNYFEYCPTPNVHMMSNIKGFVVSNQAMLCGAGGYPCNNNPTSSTSAPGITPSPDSDSPGHWSTSSPSLSPRSKNQQQHLGAIQVPQKTGQVQQTSSSVLHYHPTNNTHMIESNSHPSGAAMLQNNDLYSYQCHDNTCRY